jgi:hypothetical protein
MILHGQKLPGHSIVKRSTNVTITYKAKVDIGEKRLPPQLSTIIKLIKEAGSEGITRDALIEKLSDGNKLNTRQPVDRVLSYYHTRMEELDAVTISKPAKQPATAKTKASGSGKTTVIIGDPGAEQTTTESAGVPSPSPEGESGRARAVV